jgi:2-isopropylmalate synthase
MTDTLRIFDTTLRDGEQSPGATLTRAEKVEIARALEKMGVDIIEAGFPISSPGDFESVKAIAGEIKNSTVCGLSRCVPADIDRAGEAVKDAAKPRIHVFCATSKIHRDHKLKKGKEDILDLAVKSIQHALQYCDDVEFSPEDASRTEYEFIRDITAAAVEAGATTINLPDTVGYSYPHEYAAVFQRVLADVPAVKEKGIILSTHCHNDLGMAVANTLAAVEAGARQVEVTVNGIGERAGNASLEEIVMALRTRADHFGIDTNIDATKLFPISRMVSTLTGLSVQRNKAIVGQNAFAHEAGIHQDGVLKHRETYEIMNPSHVGVPSNALVLGKHSGRHAFRERIDTLGYAPDDTQLELAFDRFKKLADKKKEVFDEDIEAIIDDLLEQGEATKKWELVGLQVVAGSDSLTPTATVTLRSPDGDTKTDAATGDGPVDAIYSTVMRITGGEYQLVDYRIRAVTGGKDAQGEVNVELEPINGDGSATGRGLSTDILEASALAYVAAVNRLATGSRRQVTQFSGV